MSTVYIQLPESEVKRIYRKAGEKPPHVKRPFDDPEDEWVNLDELKKRTGKNTEQIRYIRKQHPEVLQIKQGRDKIGANCYLYNITQIINTKL